MALPGPAEHRFGSFGIPLEQGRSYRTRLRAGWTARASSAARRCQFFRSARQASSGGSRADGVGVGQTGRRESSATMPRPPCPGLAAPEGPVVQIRGQSQAYRPLGRAASRPRRGQGRRCRTRIRGSIGVGRVGRSSPGGRSGCLGCLQLGQQLLVASSAAVVPAPSCSCSSADSIVVTLQRSASSASPSASKSRAAPAAAIASDH